MATVKTFRSMLRKGNPRPAPGPDGWEKWWVKILSDRTISLVVNLHNYMVSNTVFPGNIKEVISVPLYKKGLRTNLVNYRGIMLSNFLANSPMTWLNFCLTPYIAKVGLIPETQIVTQIGGAKPRPHELPNRNTDMGAPEQENSVLHKTGSIKGF